MRLIDHFIDAYLYIIGFKHLQHEKNDETSVINFSKKLQDKIEIANINKNFFEYEIFLAYLSFCLFVDEAIHQSNWVHKNEWQNKSLYQKLLFVYKIKTGEFNHKKKFEYKDIFSCDISTNDLAELQVFCVQNIPTQKFSYELDQLISQIEILIKFPDSIMYKKKFELLELFYFTLILGGFQDKLKPDQQIKINQILMEEVYISV